MHEVKCYSSYLPLQLQQGPQKLSMLVFAGGPAVWEHNSDLFLHGVRLMSGAQVLESHGDFLKESAVCLAELRYRAHVCLPLLAGTSCSSRLQI